MLQSVFETQWDFVWDGMHCQYQYRAWRTGCLLQTAHHRDTCPVESVGLIADADFLFATGDACPVMDGSRRCNRDDGEIVQETDCFVLARIQIDLAKPMSRFDLHFHKQHWDVAALR